MTFVDARQLPGQPALEYDILIVGAGSLTLAREFASKHDRGSVPEGGGGCTDRADQRNFRARCRVNRG